MKLGVSSYSFSKYMKDTGANYFDICDIAKKIGFDGIEFIDLSLDVQPAESEIALAEQIRDYCAKIGLDVIAYTIAADFLKGAEEIDRVKAKVDVAAALGVKTMRHDATWNRETPWRESVARIADAIREVTVYAEGKGVRTCTENHGFVLQDAERVETLIQTVNHPNYGWLIDIGNFLCADDPAIHAVPIAAPYAFHVHVKDFVYKGKYDDHPGEGWITTRNGNYIRGTIAGHGVVPVRHCLKLIADTGYDGYVSYEFEGMEDNMTALELGHAFIRSVMP